MPDVFVHVGLPKTGTTTIQTALERRVPALRAAGVLYPGGQKAQRLAAFDLIGQRVRGDERPVVGAFGSLVEEMRAYDGRSIVFSEEELGLARPRHVKKIVQSLPRHRAFVVVGVRDMARTVVSAWQQSVVMGKTASWEEYIAAVRDSGRGNVSLALGFWRRHDLLGVIDTWSGLVPPERIRVVTVPPRGAAPATLLDRFAAAADLPPDIWGDAETTERNVSFAAAELEVIRRLDERVGGRLTPRQLRLVIENAIRPGLRGSGGRQLLLPEEHLPWARECGQELVAGLRRRGVPVFGDLDDLVPAAEVAEDRRLDEVSEAELLAAAEAALVSLAQAYGRLSWRSRRALSQAEGSSPTAGEVVGSLSRRTGFRLKKFAAEHATANRLFARTAWRYVRRRR